VSEDPGRESPRIEVVTGAATADFLAPAARLRIRVFREFPYLYDGTPAYEEEYLRVYPRAEDSVFVLARAGEDVVGLATGLPLAEADEEFRAPFREAGFPVREVFYFGESVLEPAWRGYGIGRRFMEERIRHAEGLGRFRTAAFCAVERPADHPLRPADYRPLDPFWDRCGFRRHPELRATYAWKDVGEPAETDKPMAFWLRPLRSPA